MITTFNPAARIPNDELVSDAKRIIGAYHRGEIDPFTNMALSERTFNIARAVIAFISSANNFNKYFKPAYEFEK